MEGSCEYIEHAVVDIQQGVGGLPVWGWAECKQPLITELEFYRMLDRASDKHL
jgi:hypothetical protein